MRKFLMGAAAIALAASVTHADPGGKGGGNGGGNGGGPDKAAGGPASGGAKGGGQDRGPSPQSAKPDRGPSMQSAKPDRGPSMQAEKQDRGPAIREAKADRGPAARDNGPAKEPGQAKAVRQADRGPAARRDNGPGQGNDRDIRQVRTERGNDRNVRVIDGRGGDVRYVAFDRRDYGVIDGCPPGLAKKNNGCTPPGLARDRYDSWRDDYYRPSWWGYSSLGDGRYYYDDGYLWRMNNAGSVLGYVPLLGGALSVGQQWPSYYQPYPVDDYYVDYYNLGTPNSYRYADDVLYRVDPRNDSITSIAALLTGDQFGIGQRMPGGYDVYNVPYPYRDQYVDGPDSYYRYSDGYIYQADPTTQLIQAAIQLLT
jgi:hypothetical protein